MDKFAARCRSSLIQSEFHWKSNKNISFQLIDKTEREVLEGETEIHSVQSSRRKNDFLYI